MGATGWARHSDPKGAESARFDTEEHSTDTTPALRGHSPGGTTRSGDVVTASVRLEKLDFHTERPTQANAVQARVVGKTFLGSRMAVDLRVEDANGAMLKAYVDNATGQAVGDDPVWLGWDSQSLAVLRA